MVVFFEPYCTFSPFFYGVSDVKLFFSFSHCKIFQSCSTKRRKKKYIYIYRLHYVQYTRSKCKYSWYDQDRGGTTSVLFERECTQRTYSSCHSNVTRIMCEQHSNIYNRYEVVKWWSRYRIKREVKSIKSG